MKYRIRDYLKQPELLAMLAEECAELGQAALKLRRALDGANPTPVSVEQAKKNLNEEIADVMLCLDQIACVDDEEVLEVMKRKQARWLVRLMERKGEE